MGRCSQRLRPNFSSAQVVLHALSSHSSSIWQRHRQPLHSDLLAEQYLLQNTQNWNNFLPAKHYITSKRRQLKNWDPQEEDVSNLFQLGSMHGNARWLHCCSSPPRADGSCTHIVSSSRSWWTKEHRGLQAVADLPTSWGWWPVNALYLRWRCRCSSRMRHSTSTFGAKNGNRCTTMSGSQDGHATICTDTIRVSASFDHDGIELKQLEGWARGLMRLHGLFLISNLLANKTESHT